MLLCFLKACFAQRQWLGHRGVFKLQSGLGDAHLPFRQSGEDTICRVLKKQRVHDDTVCGVWNMLGKRCFMPEQDSGWDMIQLNGV